MAFQVQNRVVLDYSKNRDNENQCDQRQSALVSGASSIFP